MEFATRAGVAGISGVLGGNGAERGDGAGEFATTGLTGAMGGGDLASKLLFEGESLWTG